MHAPCLAAILVIVTVLSGRAADAQSFGSGFAIGDGSIVVTNYHVVKGCGDIRLPDVGTATVFKSDPKADLALLKISKPFSTSLRLRTGRSLKLGEEIVVIGYPLRGLLSSPPTVTTGIVSSLAGLRDDRTEMQISAPVQPGNSGGPVLDRSGNVVGVVVAKLDAIKAALITGDIPQNVNFAVHSSILASLLDSYAINYDVAPTDSDKSITDVVAAALPAVVVIECTREAKITPPASLPNPPSVSNEDPSTSTSVRSAVLCGRSVEYELEGPATRSGLVGIWSGNWNNAGRLCGGIIVENLRTDGIADIIYVYGPSQPGNRLAWRQQRRTGVVRGGRLTFEDDQGSLFVFEAVGPDLLDAKFMGGSGKLTGSFQRR
jgi:hypothetical protein